MLVGNYAGAPESFEGILKDEAYHSFVFDNPSEALKTIEEKHFDVVICNQSIPEAGGIEFLQKLKAKSPHTAGIIMGCTDNLAEVAHIINQGYVYLFVEKPWNRQKLKKAVEMAVINSKISIKNKRVPVFNSRETSSGPDEDAR